MQGKNTDNTVNFASTQSPFPVTHRNLELCYKSVIIDGSDMFSDDLIIVLLWLALPAALFLSVGIVYQSFRKKGTLYRSYFNPPLIQEQSYNQREQSLAWNKGPGHLCTAKVIRFSMSVIYGSYYYQFQVVSVKGWLLTSFVKPVASLDSVRMMDVSEWESSTL